MLLRWPAWTKGLKKHNSSSTFQRNFCWGDGSSQCILPIADITRLSKTVLPAVFQRAISPTVAEQAGFASRLVIKLSAHDGFVLQSPYWSVTFLKTLQTPDHWAYAAAVFNFFHRSHVCSSTKQTEKWVLLSIPHLEIFQKMLKEMGIDVHTDSSHWNPEEIANELKSHFVKDKNQFSHFVLFPCGAAQSDRAQ